MKQKILIILNREFNFNDRSILNTIERFEKNKIINFLTLGNKDNKKFEHFFFIPSFLEKYFKKSIVLNFFFRLFESQKLPFSYIRILNIIWKVDPDILYIRELKYLVASIIVKKYIKRDLILHLDLREHPESQDQGKILNKLLNFFFYLFDEVTTNSQQLKDLLIKKYNFNPKKIKCLFSLPTKNFIPKIKYLKNHDHTSPLKFVFFGDIKKDRKIHLFSNALYKLDKKIKYSFDIYGSIINKDYLNSKILDNKNPNIKYCGELNYDVAGSILTKYDVAILTNEINNNSKYTIPGKFWEYLSCGLPIMSNNRPSLEFYFKNNDIGWFIETNQSWNDYLRKIIERKENLINKKKNSLKLFNLVLNNQSRLK